MFSSLLNKLVIKKASCWELISSVKQEAFFALLLFKKDEPNQVFRLQIAEVVLHINGC